MWVIKVVLLAVVILFVIIVGVQNGGEIVTFRILRWEFAGIPLNMILVEALAIGMLLGVMISIFHAVGMRTRIWRQKKEISRLTSELVAMRNLPIEEAEEEQQRMDDERRYIDR
ncbi:hypothetical protein AMJ39_06125 [candidate division TA06 bacterium DG_24]|nr:MAG: hypothetical protein AMJ39_06125 [candidate division TA06 bacterium DG_24]KPK70406.1 MAG: hypothetical protein AMJ82_03340 [candidate division TA06 bacterium SM23_40]